MAKKKLKTVYLVVGEGQTEKAFLNHLKSIFRGNSKIQIKSAGGKGPDNVLNSALAEYKQGAFKKICVFMDNDLPIPKKLSDECKKKGIKVILNDPCFECCASMKPDTNLGGIITTQTEVFYDKTTSLFFSRV
ncbi:RloB domain-containing protein [Pseudoalteromonas sp. SSMSWG5]|uniref:RloB domain-containing protein n=1 Tax=Pseudoalteromonas sp. SSMSWG5 TaxID=3139396 RepID=UPI003BAD54E8